MASKDKERIDDEEESPPKPSKKPGILKWALIGLGLVLLVAISVGTSILVMRDMLRSSTAAPAAEDRATDQAAKHQEEKAKPKEAKAPIYYKLDPPFVVNFQGQNGSRFLQVTIELMTYDPDVVPAIEQHMPVIRNNLVFLLSSVGSDQISTLEGKQKLRADTLAEIQRVLKDKIGKPGVEEVYFTSIVMQ